MITNLFLAALLQLNAGAALQPATPQLTQLNLALDQEVTITGLREACAFADRIRQQGGVILRMYQEPGTTRFHITYRM